MKIIEKIQCLFFSPTGGTRRTLSEISRNTGLRVADPIDLTLPSRRESWKGEAEGDLLLVGVPVYYGTIPSIMLEPLRRLRGDGGWAIPVAVYGNVQTGACLEELCGLLRHREFKILAAANFVAEHSFTNDDVPLALGRPDERDLKHAAEFGKKIAEKIQSDLAEVPLEGKPLEEGENYARRRDEWPENGVRELAKVSEYDERGCVSCNGCVESCPTGAIDAGTYAIDDDECIRCFSCARVCPSGVRKIELGSKVSEYFKSLVDMRKEPEFFI